MSSRNLPPLHRSSCLHVISCFHHHHHHRLVHHHHASCLRLDLHRWTATCANPCTSLPQPHHATSTPSSIALSSPRPFLPCHAPHLHDPRKGQKEGEPGERTLSCRRRTRSILMGTWVLDRTRSHPGEGTTSERCRWVGRSIQTQQQGPHRNDGRKEGGTEPCTAQRTKTRRRRMGHKDKHSV